MSVQLCGGPEYSNATGTDNKQNQINITSNYEKETSFPMS